MTETIARSKVQAALDYLQTVKPTELIEDPDKLELYASCLNYGKLLLKSILNDDLEAIKAKTAEMIRK